MSNETTLDDVLALVPSSWLDPILTGPDAALTGNGGTWGCPDVERLLSAVRKRLHDSPELRAALENARRWRHARKLLTVDDIEGMHGAWESFGRLTSEEECARADAAIDAALAKIDAALEQEPQE